MPSSPDAPSAWSRGWAVLILVSTIAVVVVTLIGAPEAIRGPITVWFVVICPGMALARLLGLGQPLIELMVGFALSLALTGLVVSVFLYVGAWSPVGSLVVLVVITIVGLTVAPVPATRDRRISMAHVIHDHGHPNPVHEPEPPLPAAPMSEPPMPNPPLPGPSVPDAPLPGSRPVIRPVFTLPSTSEPEPDPEPLWVRLAAQRPRPEPGPAVVAPVEVPPSVAPRKPTSRRATAKPTAAKPAAAKPTVAKAGAPSAGTPAVSPAAKRTTAGPVAKPRLTGPSAKQTTAKPTTTKQTTAKPAATKPAAAKPAAAKPAAAEPPEAPRTTTADGPAEAEGLPSVEPSPPDASPAPRPRRRPRPSSRPDGR